MKECRSNFLDFVQINMKSVQLCLGNSNMKSESSVLILDNNLCILTISLNIAFKWIYRYFCLCWCYLILIWCMLVIVCQCCDLNFFINNFTLSGSFPPWWPGSGSPVQTCIEAKERKKKKRKKKQEAFRERRHLHVCDYEWRKKNVLSIK